MGTRASEFGPPLSRELLLEYFLNSGTAREDWRVGMEVERLCRVRGSGAPLAYDGPGPSIRELLERYRDLRGGDPVLEGERLIGLDAPWGTISLEPGGQVEWSSRPQSSLEALERDLGQHQRALAAVTEALGVERLDVALDPQHPVTSMEWMPKARYHIMARYLGERGRLAHRMMTQTTSIQCAFDYADPQDWKRKFRAAALLAPVATAMFANSSRVDGADSGWASYRQAIWQETDPDRCGLPAVVFEPGFDIERWLDWILDVPTIFRHRARGLVPTGGIPFRDLLALSGCDALKPEDWETHVSTVFTEIRSYNYLEVRSADLLPDATAFSVPAFWTGLLYDDDALEGALELGRAFDGAERWPAAMLDAARGGLAAAPAGRPLRETALRALGVAAGGLRRGAACAERPAGALDALGRLAERIGLEIPA